MKYQQTTITKRHFTKVFSLRMMTTMITILKWDFNLQTTSKVTNPIIYLVKVIHFVSATKTAMMIIKII